MKLLELKSVTQSKKTSPPSPPGFPIVGNLPIMGKYPYKTFIKLAKQYGDVFQIRVLAQTVVVLNGLETIREALQRQKENFASRPNFYTMKNAIEGSAIGARNYGPLWKKHRDIAINALHMFVKGQADVIEQQVLQEAIQLTNILLRHEGESFDPDIDISLSVANVMLYVLFGEKFSRDDQDLVAFATHAKDFPRNTGGTLLADFVPQTAIFFKYFRLGLDKWDNILNLLKTLIYKNLDQYRDSHDPENLRGMVDALIKASNELNESEKQALGLTEEVIVQGTPRELMGAALIPISPLIRWAILHLIANPDIQAKIHEELDAVLGRDGQACMRDRSKLPFMEAFIHELLRHALSFPMALPYATTNDATINGYFIPKDTPVFVNLYSLTRDERFWEEPEKFNPYRFLNDKNEIREDMLDKYYPFGLGKRRCFGEYLARLELFIFIANLMHKCEFERVPGEKLNFDSYPGTQAIPENFNVKIKSRF